MTNTAIADATITLGVLLTRMDSSFSEIGLRQPRLWMTVNGWHGFMPGCGG
jgi:hypothetical protein